MIPQSKKVAGNTREEHTNNFVVHFGLGKPGVSDGKWPYYSQDFQTCIEPRQAEYG